MRLSSLCSRRTAPFRWTRSRASVSSSQSSLRRRLRCCHTIHFLTTSRRMRSALGPSRSLRRCSRIRCVASRVFAVVVVVVVCVCCDEREKRRGERKKKKKKKKKKKRDYSLSLSHTFLPSLVPPFLSLPTPLSPSPSPLLPPPSSDIPSLLALLSPSPSLPIPPSCSRRAAVSG